MVKIGMVFDDGCGEKYIVVYVDYSFDKREVLYSLVSLSNFNRYSEPMVLSDLKLLIELDKFTYVGTFGDLYRVI